MRVGGEVTMKVLNLIEIMLLILKKTKEKIVIKMLKTLGVMLLRLMKLIGKMSILQQKDLE